ncbi:hypothetical protein HDV05_003447 [Chytridiales sp. JEL 0842]|nr:hypothetical protein HDV05_003447 [Chytridiales sp. JEL 0842]
MAIGPRLLFVTVGTVVIGAAARGMYGAWCYSSGKDVAYGTDTILLGYTTYMIARQQVGVFLNKTKFYFSPSLDFLISQIPLCLAHILLFALGRQTLSYQAIVGIGSPLILWSTVSALLITYKEGAKFGSVSHIMESFKLNFAVTAFSWAVLFIISTTFWVSAITNFNSGGIGDILDSNSVIFLAYTGAIYPILKNLMIAIYISKVINKMVTRDSESGMDAVSWQIQFSIGYETLFSIPGILITFRHRDIGVYTRTVFGYMFVDMGFRIYSAYMLRMRLRKLEGRTAPLPGIDISDDSEDPSDDDGTPKTASGDTFPSSNLSSNKSSQLHTNSDTINEAQKETSGISSPHHEITVQNLPPHIEEIVDFTTISSKSDSTDAWQTTKSINSSRSPKKLLRTPTTSTPSRVRTRRASAADSAASDYSEDRFKEMQNAMKDYDNLAWDDVKSNPLAKDQNIRSKSIIATSLLEEPPLDSQESSVEASMPLSQPEEPLEKPPPFPARSKTRKIDTSIFKEIYAINAIALIYAKWISRLTSVILVTALIYFIPETSCYGRPTSEKLLQYTGVMVGIGLLSDIIAHFPKTRITLQFNTAACGLAKSGNRAEQAEGYSSVQVGEDAFFSRFDAIGVADGVGGWLDVKGSNPALFSLKLMHYANEYLEAFDDITNCDYDIDDYYNLNARTILQQAYLRTTEDATEDGIIGSTTALLAILRDDELRISNLGDCGIMVIRSRELVFRSDEQQHSFNFPFQLGTGSKDKPKDALDFVIKVQVGDIIVMGSDGLFDNLFDQDIMNIILNILNSSASSSSASGMTSVPSLISNTLLQRAREIAEDSRTNNCPFQSRAIQEGLYYQGGKLDDCTVVATVISTREDSPDRSCEVPIQKSKESGGGGQRSGRTRSKATKNRRIEAVENERPISKRLQQAKRPTSAASSCAKGAKTSMGQGSSSEAYNNRDTIIATGYNQVDIRNSSAAPPAPFVAEPFVDDTGSSDPPSASASSIAGCSSDSSNGSSVSNRYNPRSDDDHDDNRTISIQSFKTPAAAYSTDSEGDDSLIFKEDPAKGASAPGAAANSSQPSVKKKSRNQEVAAAAAIAAIKAQQAKKAAEDARRQAEEEMRASVRAKNSKGGKKAGVDNRRPSAGEEKSGKAEPSVAADKALKASSSAAQKESMSSAEIDPQSAGTPNNGGGLTGLASATASSAPTNPNVLNRSTPSSKPQSQPTQQQPISQQPIQQAPPPAYPTPYPYPLSNPPLQDCHPDCPGNHPHFPTNADPIPYANPNMYDYTSYPATYAEFPPPPPPAPIIGNPGSATVPNLSGNPGVSEGLTPQALFSKQSTKDYLSSTSLNFENTYGYHHCNDPNCPENYPPPNPYTAKHNGAPVKLPPGTVLSMYNNKPMKVPRPKKHNASVPLPLPPPAPATTFSGVPSSSTYRVDDELDDGDMGEDDGGSEDGGVSLVGDHASSSSASAMLQQVKKKNGPSVAKKKKRMLAGVSAEAVAGAAVSAGVYAASQAGGGGMGGGLNAAGGSVLGNVNVGGAGVSSVRLGLGMGVVGGLASVVGQNPHQMGMGAKVGGAVGIGGLKPKTLVASALMGYGNPGGGGIGFSTVGGSGGMKGDVPGISKAFEFGKSGVSTASSSSKETGTPDSTAKESEKVRSLDLSKIDHLEETTGLDELDYTYIQFQKDLMEMPELFEDDKATSTAPVLSASQPHNHLSHDKSHAPAPMYPPPPPAHHHAHHGQPIGGLPPASYPPPPHPHPQYGYQRPPYPPQHHQHQQQQQQQQQQQHAAQQGIHRVGKEHRPSAPHPAQPSHVVANGPTAPHSNQQQQPSQPQPAPQESQPKKKGSLNKKAAADAAPPSADTQPPAPKTVLDMFTKSAVPQRYRKARYRSALQRERAAGGLVAGRGNVGEKSSAGGVGEFVCFFCEYEHLFAGDLFRKAARRGGRYRKEPGE